MRKTSTIRARIEPNLKDKAEHIFRQLGLTTTQAITLFYKQVELKKGLPFDIAIPNEITRQTFDDTDAGRNRVICDNTYDMFKKLGGYDAQYITFKAPIPVPAPPTPTPEPIPEPSTCKIGNGIASCLNIYSRAAHRRGRFHYLNNIQ